MYAKMTSTTWTLDRPARSTLEGCDLEFEHELGCPMQGPPPQGKPLDWCTCYVSRIRLVKTPVGQVLPTTEPDLRALGKFWHNEAERLRRSNTTLAICLLVSAASGIATAIGFASELGVL